MLLIRVKELEDRSQHQARLIERQAHEIEQQAREMNRQAQENQQQAKFQQQEIERLKFTVGQLEQEMNGTKQNGATKPTFVHEAHPYEPDTRSQFTAFACTGDTISFACPGNRTILMTTGNYGQHEITCSDCCAPNQLQDCTEVIEENRPSDWIAIPCCKISC